MRLQTGRKGWSRRARSRCVSSQSPGQRWRRREAAPSTALTAALHPPPREGVLPASPEKLHQCQHEAPRRQTSSPERVHTAAVLGCGLYGASACTVSPCSPRDHPTELPACARRPEKTHWPCTSALIVCQEPGRCVCPEVQEAGAPALRCGGPVRRCPLPPPSWPCSRSSPASDGGASSGLGQHGAPAFPPCPLGAGLPHA